jgi:hypothetical protein
VPLRPHAGPEVGHRRADSHQEVRLVARGQRLTQTRFTSAPTGIGGQSDVWPTISGGQRREKVSVDRSSAALTGQLDRSARRVDPKRRKPALL